MKEQTQSISDELSQRLVDSMDKVGEWLDAGANFMGEQAPLIAYEIVAFERAYCTFIVVVTTLILILGPLLINRNWKIEDKKDRPWEKPSFNSLVILAMVPIIFVSSLTWLCTTKSFLMAWFAPRLVILDYLKDLMR